MTTKGRTTAQNIVQFMRQHIGIPYVYTEIAKEINYPGKPGQVATALSQLAAIPESGIHRLARGTYIFRPVSTEDARRDIAENLTGIALPETPKTIELQPTKIPRPEDVVYQGIGFTGNGEPIVRNVDDNRVFKLTEL